MLPSVPLDSAMVLGEDFFMPDPAKRYSDREVALIIKKSLATTQADAGGLELADIEAIARETGIAVEAVRRVAKGMAEKKTAAGFWLGAETRSEDGEIAEVAPTPGQLGELLGSLSALAGTNGRGAVAGRGIHWTSDVVDRKRTAVNVVRTDIEISVGDDGTRVSVRRNFAMMALFTQFKGIGIGTVGAAALAIGGILGGFALIGAVGALGIFAGAWLVTRAVFRAIVRNGRKKAAEIAARIKQALGSFKKKT